MSFQRALWVQLQISHASEDCDINTAQSNTAKIKKAKDTRKVNTD